MFIIATSGRCGTKAICDGLAQYSDFAVRHEPEPMLEEAWLKHNGKDYRTPTFEARMASFAEHDTSAYGESFRAPNLLADVHAVAPNTKFLIAVRKPTEYIRSAHSRGVLRRGDGWDLFRLMPSENVSASLALRIASHWQTINQYLLDFADQHGCPVVTHRDWAQLLDRLPQWLGLRITDHRALTEYWATKPNVSVGSDLPDGFDEVAIDEITGPTWSRARRMSASFG